MRMRVTTALALTVAVAVAVLAVAVGGAVIDRSIPAIALTVTPETHTIAQVGVGVDPIVAVAAPAAVPRAAAVPGAGPAFAPLAPSFPNADTPATHKYLKWDIKTKVDAITNAEVAAKVAAKVAEKAAEKVPATDKTAAAAAAAGPKVKTVAAAAAGTGPNVKAVVDDKAAPAAALAATVPETPIPMVWDGHGQGHTVGAKLLSLVDRRSLKYGDHVEVVGAGSRKDGAPSLLVKYGNGKVVDLLFTQVMPDLHSPDADAPAPPAASTLTNAGPPWPMLHSRRLALASTDADADAGPSAFGGSTVGPPGGSTAGPPGITNSASGTLSPSAAGTNIATGPGTTANAAAATSVCQCSGCWTGTSGPCQQPNSVCSVYTSGTTCPSGTSTCCPAIIPSTAAAPAAAGTAATAATPAAPGTAGARHDLLVEDSLGMGARNTSYVSAIIGGGGGDYMTIYSTTWWLLWHERYVEIMALVNPKNESDPTATNPSTVADNVLESQAEEVVVRREEAINRLNTLQRDMNEKIRTYWEYLSNSTLNRQPYPHGRNVEMYSEGIFRNEDKTQWVMTFSIHFDRAEDERDAVSKYWLRWSSDCTDMGRLEADMPPFFIMQADILETKYHHTVGPVRVPAGANCILMYTADLLSQPYPYPVPIPLPQFRFPKPEVEFPANCIKGNMSCFDRAGTGHSADDETTCQDLMGMDCCRLPQCIGCAQCSQIRNFMPDQPKARIIAPSEPCTDRWERQGFSKQFGFSCQTAIKWGLMDCVHDKKDGSGPQLCRRTCNFCKHDINDFAGQP